MYGAQPLRVAVVASRRSPRASNGSSSYTRSSQTFFSASASSIFWRRIFGSSRSWTRIPMPRRLVGVGRADPAPRRADLQLAEPPLARAVERDVPRHDQVRVARDEHERRRSTSPRASRSSSSSIRTPGSTTQPAPMAHSLPRDDPRRDLADLVRLAADDDRVPGVRAALVAADEVGLLGEQVDDLALALVAPLRADDHGRRHARQSRTKREVRPARRPRRGLLGVWRPPRKHAGRREHTAADGLRCIRSHVDDPLAMAARENAKRLWSADKLAKLTTG